MSALGQKRTYAVQQVMSALAPIATAKADPAPSRLDRGVRCTFSKYPKPWPKLWPVAPDFLLSAGRSGRI